MGRRRRGQGGQGGRSRRPGKWPLLLLAADAVAGKSMLNSVPRHHVGGHRLEGDGGQLERHCRDGEAAPGPWRSG